MPLFEELHALACGATLTLIVSTEDASGRMTISVIPKPKDDSGEAALRQPLSLTATPQEFDLEFIDALRGYREVRASLAEQAEATKEVLEAAKAASVKKASEATSKAAKPAPRSAATASSATSIEPAAAARSEADPAAAAAEAPQAMDLFG